MGKIGNNPNRQSPVRVVDRRALVQVGVGPQRHDAIAHLHHLSKLISITYQSSSASAGHCLRGSVTCRRRVGNGVARQDADGQLSSQCALVGNARTRCAESW